MSTLLNYGFTAKSRTPKGTTRGLSKPITDGPSASTVINVKPPPLTAHVPQTSLPPIPRTAPLSIPQLERTNTKRLSRPVRPVSTVGKGKDGRPSSSSSSSRNASLQSVDSPVKFTATLFPPLHVPAPLLRRPSKGLQDSSQRIQNILQARHISQLAVPDNGAGPARSASRNSIGSTPISAYAGHDDKKHPLSLQTHFASSWEREMALTPIEMDLGALEVIASLPETARPAHKQTLVRGRPTFRKTAFQASSRRSVVAVELPGGSLMTVITPEQSAWQRAPYIPGPIRLAPKNRSDLSALAIIQENVNVDIRTDQEATAEQAFVDDLCAFVDSFGDHFQVKETGFDTFWKKERPSSGKLFDLPATLASTLLQMPTIADAPRPFESGSKVPRHMDDGLRGPPDPDFLHDMPSAHLKRASYASSSRSNTSRVGASTSNSTLVQSTAASEDTFGSSPPQNSPGLAGLLSSSPRKGRLVKTKGPATPGQEMSFRELIRSAASIV